MNWLKTRTVAFLAGVILVSAWGAGAQTAPWEESSLAQESPAGPNGAAPVVHRGLFTIDVDVNDAEGKPVSGLSPWDFTLLDNGEATKIRTFSNSSALSEPSPKLIFVVDTVNLTPEQVTQTESGIVRFLQRNHGYLDYECLLYRLTPEGLYSSLRPSKNGARLAQELAGTRLLWPVWSTGGGGVDSPGMWASGRTAIELSLRTLGAIAIGQRDVPGRKVVVWIGPGWPAYSGVVGFDEATELFTRLQEARITLDNVNVWLNLTPSLADGDDLAAPRSQKDMQPDKVALQVIAKHTGGLVLDASEDLDGGIERCTAELRGFYTLTFNPPHPSGEDEYHELRVEVGRGVGQSQGKVRALRGYYNEPVYFDNPRPEVERVTAAQLEALVHSRNDLARRLANVELSERVSTPRLEALLKAIHGERERQALTAAADLSIGLAPPPDEVVHRPPPELGEQRALLLRTFDYLQNAIPKLPDFYALRTTVRFEEPPERDKASWKIPPPDRSLHFATGEHATVLYRNGQEVVEKKQKLGKGPAMRGMRARGLEARGTFGPILSYLLAAAASNSSGLRWMRWERGKSGDLAVFGYRVSGSDQAPELTYCCLPQNNGSTLYRSRPDDVGEFEVNPETGPLCGL